MRANLEFEDQMTVEEVLAFTAARPDGERWEPIEGVAVLNASPRQFHQSIAENILAYLLQCRRGRATSWMPLLGFGTRVPVSPMSLPQPDVMVKEADPLDRSVTDEALVLFEVISPSNKRNDRAWRRRVYASIPNYQHYVTISQRKAWVERFDRTARWEPCEHNSLDDVLALPAIDVTMPLAEIDRDTLLAGRAARSRQRQSSG
jgi:Uma2 family endonuclease